MSTRNASLRVFLSTVSAEFRAYRNALAKDLTRHNVEVKVQEDFNDLGGTTLDKLDVYIAACDLVVHLVGDMTGACPLEREVVALNAKYLDLTNRLPPVAEAIRQGAPISYTHWEAWLALYHDTPLQIARAAKGASTEETYVCDPTAQAEQTSHLARLAAVGRFPGSQAFTSPDNLAKQVLAGGILDRLAETHGKKPRRPSNLPFASLGQLFKGREAFLAQLHEALGVTAPGQATAVVGKALHGLGGVGKTRLAVEYAYRHEAAHTATLFVRADTPALLNASLATLAGPDILDLPEKDAPEDNVKIPAALGWLKNNPGWLMILDNVDSEEAAKAVQTLLARLRGGKVLITGRLTKYPGAVKKLELNVLATDDAASFLLERTEGDRQATPDDAALAKTLAGELGGLALGLEQAGAYIATEHIAFARYLELWRDKRASVVDWFDRDLMEYDHDTGLAATWAASVDRLMPDSRRLLDRLAFFAPEPIPDSLLDVRAEGDDLDARAAISGLYAYSLVSRMQVEAREISAAGFVVHRLVQDFAIRAMSETRRAESLRESLAWIDVGFAGHPWDVRTWPTLDPLTSHTIALATHGDQSDVLEPTGTLLARLGVLLEARARYSESERVKRRSVALGELQYGSSHPEIAVRLNNLAQLLQATNRLAEAEPMMRRVLAIAEASYGPDHPSVAAHLNNLAALLLATNLLAEAEPMMRRALAIDEASYGPDHPEVACALNNLAQLLKVTNRLAEAEPMMWRALAIDEASCGPDHPNVAVRLSNLATLLQATNRLAEAEPMMRRALTIDETSYGLDHPEVATDLNNLAALLQTTNRHGEAEPMVRRALAIDEVSYGPNHPKVAIRLNNLAQSFQATSRLEEAEPMMLRALTIDEASYGPEHPNVAIRLNNLARLLQATNRLEEAEPMMRRALAIDEASYGPDNPEVARDLNNLASLLSVTNRVDEADPMMWRALAIDEASYGPNHPIVARDLNNLGQFLWATNRLDEAELTTRRALAIFETSYGPDHRSTIAVRGNLAALLQVKVAR